MIQKGARRLIMMHNSIVQLFLKKEKLDLNDLLSQVYLE